MREVIQHMKNGVLVKEKAPEEIAKAIQQLIEDPSLMGELAHNAREYVLQNHSYLAHAQKVLTIYQTVLER
jgi:glycosyltransferase involved in cell wall biosynthesis